MSWFSFRPYVSVAERRRKAQAAAKKMAAKTGRPLAPIRLPGRTIATTFWGKAWCDNLESYSDYANRLPRGRSYVRSGSVIDLQIAKGRVEALVQGSELYRVAIGFRALPAKRWQAFKSRCAGKVTNLLDLLQGRLSKDILADITTQGTGLFPAPQEIDLDCSCPDWADMCKHVASVLYGVGARLDEKPELFFTLRGVQMEELITAASATAAAPATGPAADAALAEANLSEIFGVEIDTASPVPPPAMKSLTRAKVTKKPATTTKKPKSKAATSRRKPRNRRADSSTP